MNFRRIRRPLLFLLTVPLTLAVGLAVYAAWTSSGILQQSISSGSGPSITMTSTSGTTVGNTLTLTAESNVDPTWTTGDQAVTIKNSGSANATEVNAVVSASPSNQLDVETNLCIADGASGLVLYNGPLSSAGTITLGITVAPGSVDHETMNLYSGAVSEYCGNVAAGSDSPGDAVSSSAPLDMSASGLTTEMTITYTFSS